MPASACKVEAPDHPDICAQTYEAEHQTCTGGYEGNLKDCVVDILVNKRHIRMLAYRHPQATAEWSSMLSSVQSISGPYSRAQDQHSQSQCLHLGVAGPALQQYARVQEIDMWLQTAEVRKIDALNQL